MYDYYINRHNTIVLLPIDCTCILHSQPSYLNTIHTLFCISDTVYNKLVFALFFQHQDGKTALYWAVEKGNATMVRDILQCNPDTESCTKVRHTQ